MSLDGIFFYSDRKPELESELDVTLHLDGVDITYTGRVVRVEEPAPGAAVGVAIQIQRSGATSTLVN